MSDNPFATPNQFDAQKYAVSSGENAPGALTTILIIVMILAILGLLGICFGGLGLVAQTAMELPNPNNDPKVAELLEAQRAVQQHQFIPNVITLGLNIVLAPLLLIGAIGCLNRKSWGHNLLSIGLLLAIGFVILRAIINSYVTIISMSSMSEMMEKQMKLQGGANAAEGAEVMGSMMGMFGIVGVVFIIVSALVLAGFYIWSRSYLQKPEVKRYLGAA